MNDENLKTSDLQRLMAIASREFQTEPDTLTDASSPETVGGWDSLTHFNLFMAIQSEFGIQLSNLDMLGMKDIGTIRGVLRKHGLRL